MKGETRNLKEDSLIVDWRLPMGVRQDERTPLFSRTMMDLRQWRQKKEICYAL